MDTVQSIAIYALATLLFLLGAYALLVAWLPVPAKYLENRMSRGTGARIAGLVFALALPQVYFLAPHLGRSDAVTVEGQRKQTEAVLEVSRDLHKLAEENLRDRDESKESLQRAERRVAEMGKLTERLKLMQQEDQVQFADQEAQATRKWQWAILAVCFGFGLLIARYTGLSIS
jgi:hypothetical protein